MDQLKVRGSGTKVGTACKLLAMSSLVASWGCSLIFVDGPPSAHASMQSFSCDESRAFPMIDGGLAALSLVGMFTAETKTDTTFLFGGYSTDTSFKSEQLVTGAVGLALYGTSAVIGWRRVTRCRNAMGELRDRLTTQEVSPPR